ncbi:MAG TPA: DUF3040 domain-containing protein [Gordonia sp. (in: high G+C Gram-positive bacteria)]|uniref:DUF3040 domain-containing protein n=1 Tax=unclassified Gordonia (in: high G+C Gram-positive bacteria) TaxID=2657482 RepID=UPI000FB4B83F|nr:MULTISPECIES: DUF3040 domain-containing protein [unclassified Gordonia (in: high G+C Gram-positive bacteria)]RTL06245.1 MAG: DUF3040 domain-containing protein [Acidimicrobiia bacterium]HNP58685.1 DUF3040 domain-containing protein [Gordonia sp. (in: high G+C Gram-positive bacteria)]HRC51113.1 DUF3040 domain-containing protein [Gordonia sp. (in: high G+C Gram-positive bacteria)]
MPLSEHEQRMLDQIESALYADDPKFASTVHRRSLAPGRRRAQAVVLFLVGLALLVGGIVAGVQVGGFPILSLIGFLVMFGAGLLALRGGKPSLKSVDGRGGPSRPTASARSLSERMEDRFNRRFNEE